MVRTRGDRRSQPSGVSRPGASGPHRLALVIWKQGITAGSSLGGGVDTSTSIRVAARRMGTTRFSRPITLARHADGPRIAMSPDGETLISWRDRHGRVHVVDRPPTGPFGRPQRVSGPAGGYALALGADGTAVIAWEHGEFPETSIRAAVREPGKGFGEWREIGPSGALPVDVNSSGEAIVAWEDAGTAGDRPAMASLLAVDGTFSAPKVILNSERTNAGLSTAIADDGTAAVIANGEVLRQVVKASVLQPDGTFSRARPLSAGNGGNFGEVVVEGNHFRAVWAAGGTSRITTSRYRGSASWSPPRTLGGRYVNFTTVAANGAGMTAVLGVANDAGMRIRAFIRSPGEGWSGEESVAEFASARSAVWPAVALNAVGRVLVGWAGPHVQHDRGVFVGWRRRSQT